MQSVLVPIENGFRVHVDIVVDYLEVGLCLRTKSSFGAVLQAAYTFPELSLVMRFIEAMRVRKVLPEVYIWDETSIQPEVAVVFRVPKASLDFLKSLTNENGAVILEEASSLGENEVVTVAWANIEQDGVEKFLQAFNENKTAHVAVLESGEDASHAAIHFDVTTINRHPPRELDL